MYAADVMSMEELKEKTSCIDRETEALRERINRVRAPDTDIKNSAERDRIYREEIEAFLALENVTNGEMRKMISRIIVNREGEVKVCLRSLSDLSATSHIPISGQL